MDLAVESDRLIQEIRDLRARQQRVFLADLADIDRDYEQQLRRIDHAARRARLVHVCVWTLTALLLAATLISG
jgi:hypothetical protein